MSSEGEDIGADGEDFVYTRIHANRDEQITGMPNSVSFNVVRVRVDPSVTTIHAEAFYKRKKLTEVELSEGVVEIGIRSFASSMFAGQHCNHSIKKFNTPTSLRRIDDFALQGSLRCPIRLHVGIESIGAYAFGYCIFTNFRVPPLITVIPDGMLSNCRSMFSLELSEIVSEIGFKAFWQCFSLRNVALPPNVVCGDEIFIDEDEEIYTTTDLLQLFGSNASIIWELQHRFDELPIHSIVYYQSYYQGVLQRLLAAINMRSGQSRTLRVKLNPTGNQQDCLGMTPLHILACSSVHNLDVYRLIVEKYPANLVTQDRWGALPLLYAFWGAAPAEIIQFLLESYQSFYPGYELNWTNMVWTMGRTDTPKESIKNLLRVKQLHFPEQPLDWEYLLNKFMGQSNFCFRGTFRERLQFLVMCGLSESVEALPFKFWRDHITNMIQTSNFKFDGNNWEQILHRIRAKITRFEDDIPKLKDVTTALELALWKVRMTVNNVHQEGINHRRKKKKTDEASIRRQCRVTCGADVIIRLVLPFLITAEDEESCSDSDSESESQNVNPTAPNCSIS
jgi:hypothetical protein